MADEMVLTRLGEEWGWKSWVASANLPGCDFPLQNLAFCAFDSETGDEPHLGVGIGDFVTDLHILSGSSLFDDLPEGVRKACRAPCLNELMGYGRGATSLLRRALMIALEESGEKTWRALVEGAFLRRSDVRYRSPVEVPNYTDFYASIDHATNVGRLLRPDQPLLPNYKFVPIGYHGRASSIVVSGTAVTRPCGQTKPLSAAAPTFGPTRQLDYELEVGAYIGTGNQLGHSIPIARAEDFLFGISLLNDWSARDIQAWEYQPLGPFLGKSFATSVSPWVVTMDALAPFRVALPARGAGDPAPLPYLDLPEASAAAIDLTLLVYLSTAAMQARSQAPVCLGRGNLRNLYWSFGQMITHHSSNGCNLIPGDLIGSGTVSGSDDDSRGSLLEITERGASPVRLPTGETRSFLEDGDEVVLQGFCERSGLPRIGLGECRGIITPGLC